MKTNVVENPRKLNKNFLTLFPPLLLTPKQIGLRFLRSCLCLICSGLHQFVIKRVMLEYDSAMATGRFRENVQQQVLRMGGKTQAGMAMVVRPWLETWIRLKRE
jgi:hypothetical protein